MEKNDILRGLKDYRNDICVKAVRGGVEFLDLCLKETEETLNKETAENLNYWANLEELTRFIEFVTNGKFNAKIPRKHTAEMLLKRYVPRSLYALAIYNNLRNELCKDANYNRGIYGFVAGEKFLGANGAPFIYMGKATPMLVALRQYCLTDLGKQSYIYGNYREYENSTDIIKLRFNLCE